MFQWSPFPFVRIVLFFMAGILWGIYRPDSFSQRNTILTIIILVVLYGVAFTIQRYRYRFTNNLGLIALPVIFLSGYVLVLSKTDWRQSDHLMHVRDTVKYYQAVVISAPQEKERSWKLEASVLKVQSDEWKEVQGKIILYLPKKEFYEPFQYGDILLVKGSPQRVQPPANPGEFDYQRFLSFRKIYHQHFLHKPDVVYMKDGAPSAIMQYSIHARRWAETTLKKYVQGNREQAIASALVLGVTDGLDNELLNAYAATGAMHVLAVSGLHVSIIYWIIAMLLSPLSRSATGRWVLAGISIFLLWGYAFVTGLSPSVLRAVTMFSMMALAKPWNQHTNIYNTLGASAFLLLLWEPYMIMSVGFQLSFLAVLGIVYLQPMIQQWWQPKNSFLEKVWQITCVSISAQMATFSLGLLYFHQFPNYFLFSNLFVIPGSFGVLIAGLAVLAFSVFHPVAIVLGMVLEWLIRILNFVVFTVEAFPFSLVENIQISTMQCWLLMGFIVMVVLMIKNRKFSYAIMAFGFIMVYSGLQWQQFFEQVNLKKLTIYKIPGYSAVDLVEEGKSIFFGDVALLRDAEKVRFHIRPNRLISGVDVVYRGNEMAITRQMKGCRVIQWRGKSILQIEERKFFVPEKLSVDFLIVSHNSVTDINELIERINVGQIILDSSNSFYFSDNILKQMMSRRVNVFSVLHQGAFDVEIENQHT